MVVHREGSGWQVPPRDAAAKRTTGQGVSSLKLGAEALLWQTPRALPAADAVSRATARHELRSGRHRLPPEMTEAVGISTGMHAPRHPPEPSTVSFEGGTLLVSETPGAVAQLCEAQVWGPDIDYQARDCNIVLRRSSTINDKHGNELRLDEGDVPAEENLAKVQRFLARARGHGVRRMPLLVDAFEAASVDGVLDLTAFTKVAMDAGLCKSFFECRCAFRFFVRYSGSCSHGNNLVSKDFLAEMLREPLCSERAAIVRNVWRRFDPEESGEVEMRKILAVFDARKLPQVVYGEVDIVEAVRELIEALGANDSVIPHLEKDDFAFNEAAARRRPMPTGGRSSPLESAAGKPCGGPDRPSIPESRRVDRDCLNELAARRPEVNLSHRVSAVDFEAYYACISMATPDHVLFEQVAQNPWTSAKVHAEAMSSRYDAHIRRKEPVRAAFRILAVFEDGSRRMVRLRDDANLQEVAQGAGGMHCNQMWTWGPNVKREVMQRLEAQGYQGIVSVNIQPP